MTDRCDCPYPDPVTYGGPNPLCPEHGDVEWADANPQPHTITREQFDAAEKRYWNYVHSNDADLALLAAFHSAGIEVTDDE